MKKLSLFLSILISAIFLYLSFSNFNFQETLNYMKHTRVEYIVLATIIFVFSFFLRGIRWKILLQNSGDISIKTATSNIFIGQMGNNILPWRMGDLWRVIMLKRQNRVSMVSSGASLGTERLYDGITIVILGIISSSIYSIHMRMLKLLYILGGVILGIILLLWLFFKFFGEKEGKFIKNLLSGISTLKDPVKFLYLIGFSLVIWSVESLSFYYFFLSSGFKLSILQVFFVVFSLNLALLIPAAPASLGTFEYAIVFSCKLFHIPKSAALSLALTIHFMRFLSINLVAIIFMLLLGIKFKREIKELEEAANVQDETA